MHTADAVTPGAELRQTIERQIAQRTWGRIHRLALEDRENRLIVHGYTCSYYVKQLAIQAILDVVGAEAKEVQVDIEVGAAGPAPGIGQERL
jgi:hypothetical protein